MKVSELIEALKLMPQDLEVYSYCDHGQTPEKSCSPSIQWMDDDFENFTCNKMEAEDNGYENQVVLL